MTQLPASRPPTLPDLSPEANEAFLSLTPQQAAFVVAYQRSGRQSDAYREAYPTSRDWDPAIVATEANRLMKHPKISLIVAAAKETAMAMLEQSLPMQVQRIEKLSAMADDPDTQSASRLAIAERAIRTSFEAGGVIGRGATVQVNIDNRRIDDVALRLWQERNAAPEP